MEAYINLNGLHRNKMTNNFALSAMKVFLW